MRGRTTALLGRLVSAVFGLRARERATRERAEALLHQMLGADAHFRDGQLEAICAAVKQRSRVLVVQRTGWGKSLVYFVAAQMLRETGAGPALIISPLLSLMRNQIEMAERIGVRALSITSENRVQWEAIEQALAGDACDVVLVSPERLASTSFQTRILPSLPRGIGLLVVDEAHCISDWGHDFRPDYRRILGIVRRLPRGVPVLATTATANKRVIADIRVQLGPRLRVLRGPLGRPSLQLQVIRLADQSERLAWLAGHLPELPGSGIVYCLTVVDCERVSKWLESQGIAAPAYHAGLLGERRAELEQKLLRNEVKALVATVALGMGFDKPDLCFVVHYQRPGSAVAYYQQIGRAGRGVDQARVVLLTGQEDDEIQEHFIRNAFPGFDAMRLIVATLEEGDGRSIDGLLARLNLSYAQVEQCLRLLEVDGMVQREGRRYRRTAEAWTPDRERVRRVTALRREELRHMQGLVSAPGCLMQMVVRELDDARPGRCGRCAGCGGAVVPDSIDPALVAEAVACLRGQAPRIEPRVSWPSGMWEAASAEIEPRLQNAEGRALCLYNDPGWGRLVAAGKYRDGRFDDALVQAAAELVQQRWRPLPAPAWVTAVPSRRRPLLVADFAGRLAAALRLPFRGALQNLYELQEQKSMRNNAKQCANVRHAFRASPERVLPGPVLLVDDMVDSRWTLTICGQLLRDAGSGMVYPFALASARATEQWS